MRPLLFRPPDLRSGSVSERLGRGLGDLAEVEAGLEASAGRCRAGTGRWASSGSLEEVDAVTLGEGHVRLLPVRAAAHWCGRRVGSCRGCCAVRTLSTFTLNSVSTAWRDLDLVGVADGRGTRPGCPLSLTSVPFSVMSGARRRRRSTLHASPTRATSAVERVARQDEVACPQDVVHVEAGDARAP